jgi:voltage-gated potassium channel
VDAERRTPARSSLRSRLGERAIVAVKTGRVFRYLVAITALTAVATGLIAHLIDRKDFATFGVGLWWAIVTLGTVGYGDVVPHTAWGRVLGGVVIVFGVTFISFLVAIVTSLFVDANRADQEGALQTRHEEILATLQSMDARLGALEERGGEGAAAPPS